MTWPVTLTDGPVGLRQLRLRDGARWRELRTANRRWLEPWEATPPDPGAPAMQYPQLVRALNREARAGRGLPFAITYEREMVGQLSVSGIGWGSLCSANLGYWISEHVAGRGITPTAVALATDHCLLTLGLHRMEVNVRPENAASLRVVAKLGFRDEGVRLKYLHIDGAWRDHRTFAITREELGPGGMLGHWHGVRSPGE
ncbi:GNAT family N-acetyltransferase [Angustibacter sp. McL0619]|uniref:GNAT family N-acetyltransferase n=1 Tax=Angustibacter sp. McL0619 TaxID=3415676 RepID=UPI003CEFBA09